MISLEFTPDEVGHARYEICTQAFILTTYQPRLDEYDDIASVLRKLKAIGEPNKIVANGTNLTVYDLVEGGGVVELERSEWKTLFDFVNRPIWRAGTIEVVLDCKNWLNSFDPSRK